MLSLILCRRHVKSGLWPGRQVQKHFTTEEYETSDPQGWTVLIWVILAGKNVLRNRLSEP